MRTIKKILDGQIQNSRFVNSSCRKFFWFFLSITFLLTFSLAGCCNSSYSHDRDRSKDRNIHQPRSHQYSNRPFNRRTEWEVNPYGRDGFRN